MTALERRWVRALCLTAGFFAALPAEGQSVPPPPAPVAPAPSVPPASAPAPSAPTPSAAAPNAAPVPSGPVPLAVFPAHAQGVDPSVGNFVTDRLRKTAEALGYSVVSDERARAAIGSSAGPLSPAQAGGLMRAAGAERGVFATVNAAGARYQVVIHVTSSDGKGPFLAQGDADPSALSETLDRLLRSVLPAVPRPPPEASARQQSPGRFRFAAQTEAAFGVAGGSFYNHLVGVRLDRRFSDVVALGGYVGYANLKGQEGRAHNVLAYLMLEYRLELGGGFVVPLRYANGYLPKNGPLLRGSVGIGYTTGDVDLVLELVTPTVWVTHDQAVLSMDLGAEVAWSF